MSWENNDGLVVRFNKEVGVRGNKAGVTADASHRRHMTLTLVLTGAARTLFTADNNNDGTNDGFNGLDTPLPSGAKIVDVQFRNVVTPAGGTNWALGTYQADGTVDDADGLLTTALGAGAQVGTQLTADRFVTAVTTGTYTAGTVAVDIEYVL